jgi:hypothetical protein
MFSLILFATYIFDAGYGHLDISRWSILVVSTVFDVQLVIQASD